MSSLYVSNELEEIIDKLSKVINTNRSGAVKIAVQELAHRCLNLPPGMIVIPKEIWDEFWGKLQDEIKGENAELLEKMVRDFGETTKEISECSKKRKEEKISLEEWIVESFASVRKAYETIKTIKPIVNEKIQGEIDGWAREMKEWEETMLEAFLPTFEKIKEAAAATLPMGERLKEIGEEQAKLTGKFGEILKDLNLGIK